MSSDNVLSRSGVKITLRRRVHVRLTVCIRKWNNCQVNFNLLHNRAVLIPSNTMPRRGNAPLMRWSRVRVPRCKVSKRGLQ